MQKINSTIIRFPEIKLESRDAHKLRGFFGNYFKEKSPLLHNHFEDGSLRYQYPLVQYKIVDGTPTLCGYLEGSELLTALFMEIKEIDINGKSYPVYSKNIQQTKSECGLTDDLINYTFKSLWMSLNEKNFEKYLKFDDKGKPAFLNQMLKSNLLSALKGLGVWLEGNLMVNGKFTEASTKFKGQKMLAFKGDFVANVQLPALLGLGKSVSRGFGTINN